MAMMDVNGRELRTGDVVLISDAFFKINNGLWFVEYSPGDASWLGWDYGLRKINKDGSLSTAKKNITFWPLIPVCNDRLKIAEAYKWNKEHAKIEILDTVNRDKIRELFNQKAADLGPYLKDYGLRWGKHSAGYVRDEKIRRHYLRVAAGIA